MEKNLFINNREDIETLRARVNLILDLLARFKSGEPAPRSNATPKELQQKFENFKLFPETGRVFSEQRDLLEQTLRHAVQINHPHTAAHLHCPPLLDAVAGDLLASALNLSMDSWDQSAVATLLEKQVLAELGEELYGREDNFAGVFTDGGTRSNLMGLLIAREVFLQNETGQSAFLDGLPAQETKPVIICSDQTHFSAQQAAALLGLGRNAVLALPADEAGRLPANRLEEIRLRLEQENRKILCVFATAGTTDRGAIDPLELIADFCEIHGVWMHVDAAAGAALLFTKWRDQLKGIERAHSVTMDFHKLFFQPIACGAFFLREKENFDLIKINAEYLNREDDPEPNLVDYSLSTTRRFDALKLLLSMRGLGRPGFEALLERLFTLTRHTAERIDSSPTLELICDPGSVMILFRFAHKKFSETELDEINAEIRRRLLSEGGAIIGRTKHNNRIVLKLTLMNPGASEADLTGLIKILENVANKIMETQEEYKMLETRNRFGYQAFLNCYLRETDNWELKLVNKNSDCPENFKSDGVRSYIEIRLSNMNERILAGIKYWSLTRRHQFYFPLYREAEGWRPLEMDDMARLSLQEMAQLKKAGKSADPEILLSKLRNSSENIDRFISERTSEIARLNQGGPLSFIETEQALLIGHQTHPSGKAREGLDSSELSVYSPELKGEFALRYFRLDPSIAHHDSALDRSAPRIIQDMLDKDPLLSSDFRKKLREKPDFPILPVHPWQAKFSLKLPEVRELIEAGLLEDLGEAGSSFTPTTSIRTVYREGFDFMFKFSLNIKITNSVRINKFWELDRSLEMARLMQTDYGQSIQDDVPDFLFIQDPAYLAVRHKGKVLESLSCLFRDASFVRGERDITSITSLVQDNPAGGKNRLYNIIADLANREGRDLEETALDWYRAYLNISIYALLKLFFKWGLCFEAHGQNSLLELENGKPRRYLYRDSQGYFHRAAAHADFCKVIPNLGEKTESIFPEDLANERLVYYLIVNQVFSVINAFGTQGLANEKTLMEEFRQTLDRVALDNPRYPTTMIAQLKSLSRLPCKGNLLTQLFNMDELVGDIATQSVYVSLPNIIKE